MSKGTELEKHGEYWGMGTGRWQSTKRMFKRDWHETRLVWSIGGAYQPVIGLELCALGNQGQF